MKPTDLKITEVKGKGAAKKVDCIIRKNHYLGSINSAATKHRYLITLPMRGIYGAVAWSKPLARMEDQENTIELHRFWTNNRTPPNTESYCLGYMMRDMEAKEYDRLISYTSTGQGHEGTIYKATNWNTTGKTRDYSSGKGWKNRANRENRDTSQKIKFEKKL